MEYFLVNESCSTIRMLARDGLAGNWKTGFFAFFVANIILVVPLEFLMWMFGEGGMFVGLLYVIIVSGPISLGMALFVLNISRGQSVQLAQIFSGFEHLGKAIGLSVIIAILVVLWGLIGFVIVFFAVMSMLQGGVLAFTFLSLLAFIAFIPALIAYIRYSQSFFILADNPDLGVFECIERSKAMMRGNKLKYFFLSLSYLGWFILASLPIALANEVIPFDARTALIGVIVLVIIPRLGLFVVELYFLTGTAVLYDMINGNLRPGTIQTEAQIIDTTNGPSNAPQNEATDFNVSHQMSTTDAQWTGEGYVPVNEQPQIVDDENVRQKEQ